LDPNENPGLYFTRFWDVQDALSDRAGGRLVRVPGRPRPPALRGRHRRGAGGGRPAQAAEAEVAARALGLQVQLMEARSRAELDSVFTSMVREKLHAALVQPSQMIFAHRTRIAELAAKNRLPAMGIIRWFAEAGGLMSYGARDIDQFQRAAYYVHKILKGAKPADLPIEQPTRFEMVINLKTAKALGLTIPQSLRRRTRSAW
jgi:ABC-type uncharacterized transport system substrate-binding protein